MLNYPDTVRPELVEGRGRGSTSSPRMGLVMCTHVYNRNYSATEHTETTEKKVTEKTHSRHVQRVTLNVFASCQEKEPCGRDDKRKK